MAFNIPAKRKVTGIHLKLIMDYKSISAVKSLTESVEGEIISEAFTDKVALKVLIPDDKGKKIRDKLPYTTEIIAI